MATDRQPVVPCFLDETGGLHLARESLFGVGLLLVPDVPPLTNALMKASLNLHTRWMAERKELRRKAQMHIGSQDRGALGELFQDGETLAKALSRSRHRELKFSAISPHNVEELLSFLRVFFANAGETAFHAMIVERNERSLAWYGGRSWPLYVHCATRLLGRRVKRPVFAIFDWQGQPEYDQLCLEDEVSKVKYVCGSVRITSDTSPFIQVTDILLGAASFDWRDSHGRLEPSQTASLKRDVVRMIKRQLHVPLDSPFLVPGATFFSRRKPLQFTVWESAPDFLKSAVETPKARGMTRGLTRGTGGLVRAPAELLVPNSLPK